MKPGRTFIWLPLLAPAAIVVLFFTPLTVMPCRTRGLVAAAVALLSAAAAFYAILRGYLARFRRDPSWIWWFFAALIYTSPLVLLLGPLG